MPHHKVVPERGLPYSGGGIVATEREQVDFLEYHCVE